MPTIEISGARNNQEVSSDIFCRHCKHSGDSIQLFSAHLWHAKDDNHHSCCSLGSIMFADDTCSAPLSPDMCSRSGFLWYTSLKCSAFVDWQHQLFFIPWVEQLAPSWHSSIRTIYNARAKLSEPQRSNLKRQKPAQLRQEFTEPCHRTPKHL